jgi:hypothetical protein
MATSKSGTTKKPAAKTTAATAKTTAKSVSSRTALAKKPATPLAKTAAPAAAKKPATRAAAPTGKPAAPTPEQRYRMVQEAAYFIAEKDGFASGAMDYWIAAEAQIEALLSGKAKK